MNPFPSRVLLATDGSEDAILAARVVAELSSKTDSELHIVHIRGMLGRATHFYLSPYIAEADLERLDMEARKLLDTQVEQIEAAGGTVTQAHLRLGKPDAEIVTLSEELGTDLIVVGSRGQGGIKRALMGSVSDSVVRHAHCSVLVVRKEKGEEELVSIFPTKILLATDGSKEAALAVRTAIDLADKTGSELHVVYVEPWPPIIDPQADERVTQAITEKKMKRAKRFLDTQVEEIQAAGGSVARAYVRKGGAAEEIVTLSEEIGAGLIMVGSRGWGRLRRALIGSVSESVVRHAHCAVLIVREEEKPASVSAAQEEQQRNHG